MFGGGKDVRQLPWRGGKEVKAERQAMQTPWPKQRGCKAGTGRGPGVSRGMAGWQNTERKSHFEKQKRDYYILLLPEEDLSHRIWPNQVASAGPTYIFKVQFNCFL